MSALDELQQAVTTVAERLDAATVAVGRDRRGSGVVIADGRVLTCAHNLRDRTTEVTFADGRQAQASVVGVDADGDLAVLEVDTAGVAPAEWSPAADGVAPGQAVFGVARRLISGRAGITPEWRRLQPPIGVHVACRSRWRQIRTLRQGVAQGFV